MLTAFLAFFESISEKVLSDTLRERLSTLRGGHISISFPRFQDNVRPSGTLGVHLTYEVRGNIKRLPSDHYLWLLVEDSTDGKLWPQGFSPIQYDALTGQWTGCITNAPGKVSTKIVAVAAPSTSNDFFNYYQKFGNHTNYAPLAHIPSECKNKTFVQANLLQS